MPKFGIRNALFEYFWARILKNYCHIWNEHLRISLISKFCKVIKMPKFGTKSALFGYFWAASLKKYCHIWNQHLRISLIPKFRKEAKPPKFATKNDLFGYFRARILKKLLSYLKSAPSNLSACKILCKNKNA